MSYAPSYCRANAVGGRANGPRCPCSCGSYVAVASGGLSLAAHCRTRARTTAQGAGGAAALLAVVEVDEFERAEAGWRPVHEEHLDREVGFDVGLAQEREHLRPVSSSISLL